MSKRRLRLATLSLAFVTACGHARVPATSPASSVPTLRSAEPSAAPDSTALLDQIGGCVESGKLSVEIDLRAGRVSAAPGWTIEVIGAPKATLVVEAAAGRVHRLDFAVAGGQLLADGKGLRPDVFIESIRFEVGKGITQARFHGRGIWRPIVGIFHGLAMSAISRLELRTDVPSILRGEVLGPKTSDSSAAPFLNLIAEVRIFDSDLVAFGGRPLRFGEVLEFVTAAQPLSGTPLRIAVRSGVFRPARGERPTWFDVAGGIDGEIETGSAAFLGGRTAFSRGELKGGAFRLRSGADGKLETSLSASSLGLDLTSGQVRVPGGPLVSVEEPSRFAVRNLSVQPDGEYSGIVDATLFGKVGTIDRGGTVVSASDMKLSTRGAAIVNGRATGNVELEFKYRMDYNLLVHYPVEGIGIRRIPLVFEGPFVTTLHLKDAGRGEEGTVTGEYRFKVPWPPIERAAFEVLKAKWSQDVTPALRKVNFAIEPGHFGPCGGTCFAIKLIVTVEKKEKRGRLFRQICDTEGKADLVVDAKTRSFLLRNVRIAPQCKGAIGWVVNFLGPLLTKSYTDVTLFQMPENLPFTIESVDSGADWLAIVGRIDSAPKAARSAPSPATSGE